jgi:uncharacterized membrane protein
MFLKIKFPIDLIIINCLSILLILSIIFIPLNIIRIILGLPFLLICPGYVLVAALFPRGEMNIIEHSALSFGMSIAVNVLIGLGLNYTQWGIRLEPMLYSISAFIVILSAIAIIRRWSYGHTGLITGINLEIEGILRGSKLNKTLNIIMIIAVLGIIGTLIYAIAKPKIGEKFTDFYILGINGQAADYPTDFTFNSDMQVISVQYGQDTVAIPEKWGQLVVGIVNHEQQHAIYTVMMQIDGTPVKILYQGDSVQNLGPIDLASGEQWMHELDIVPQHTGNNQEVELFLYKDGGTKAYLNLHLWINVTQ